MEDKIISEISKFLAIVNQQLGDTHEKELNIKPSLDACISNVISSVAIGRTYSSDDETFLRLKRSLSEFTSEFSTPTAMLLNSMPWLRYIPLWNHFGYDKMKSSVDNFFAVLLDELEVHKKELGEHFEPTDFAATYLQGTYRSSVMTVIKIVARTAAFRRTFFKY